MNFLDAIRRLARERIVYSAHALAEMLAEAEVITVEEVKKVVLTGKIIEDYPEDKRGHSFLILAKVYDIRPVHVVCAPKDGYLAIITVYVPTVNKWEPGYRIRRKK